MKFRSGPDGVHIFDRRTGLNILFDEVAVDQPKWATAPRQVSVALTNLCDLNCSYCYAPKHRAALTTEKVLSWLGELDSEGCLGVGFGGGEPTLHPDFPKICKAVTRDTQLAVTFTTHGHRLVPKLIGELEGHVHFIRVSIDGVGNTYESLRGRPFSKLLVHLRDARQIAPVGINVVVNQATVCDLGALAELADEIGAAELLLLPQQGTHAVDPIEDAVRRQLAEWVQGARTGVRLAVSEAGAQGLPTCDPLPGERGLSAYAHIDASGYLRASSYADMTTAITENGPIAALHRLRALTGDRN